MKGYGLRVALLALALGPAAASAACPSAEADGTLLRQGELLLAFRPLAGPGGGQPAGRIPMAKHFALEVQLCGPADALLKKVDATMPEHRHGMNYRPVISPLGGGRFRVEGMMLHMAGRWELAFEVQAGQETARLTHDLVID